MEKKLIKYALLFLCCFIAKSLYAIEYESRPIQVGVGYEHRCVLFENGKMKCWGVNRFGQLGYGDSKNRFASSNDLGKKLPYVNLGNNFFVKKIFINGYTTCALSSLGSLKCWGSNQSGILGYSHKRDIGAQSNDMGDSLPVLVFRDKSGRGLRLDQYFLGPVSACAVFSTGESRCWGHNYLGQLGVGTQAESVLQSEKLSPIFSDRIKFFALSLYHTCAVTVTNNLFCFGANIFGEGGIGDPSIESAGTSIESMKNLKPVDLGTRLEIVQMNLGAHHTCAVFKDRSLKCFGLNLQGELGLGRINETFGSVKQELGDSLPFVDIGSHAPVTIETGWYHTCFISRFGASLFCWGGNEFGQLGLGMTESVGDHALEMGSGLQPTDLGELQRVVSFVAGGFSSCAILEKDINTRPIALVKCWGNALDGNEVLGDDPDEFGDQIPFLDL